MSVLLTHVYLDEKILENTIVLYIMWCVCVCVNAYIFIYLIIYFGKRICYSSPHSQVGWKVTEKVNIWENHLLAL